MRPKFSIVIPTLNGASTLAVTLPAFLKIRRDDIEFVISDNKSDDDTWDLLNSFTDKRLKLIQPSERLNLSNHLDFAYLHANGYWQGHLGDDDFLIPGRFDALDKAIDEYPRLSVIRGDYIRYIWPCELDADPNPNDNSIDPKLLSEGNKFQSGIIAFRESVNSEYITGGGGWAIRHDIISKIREKFGFFSSPQHVEFFSMRAALAFSHEVLYIKEPIFVLGRHIKSVGSQAIDVNRTKKQTFNWNEDDPALWNHCTWQFKSYATISLDGALKAKSSLPECADAFVDWPYWIRAVENSLTLQIANGHINHKDGWKLFWDGAAQIPLSPLERIRLYGRHVPYLWSFWKSLRNSFNNDAKLNANSRGWTKRIYGCQSGFSNIIEASQWIAQKLAIERL